MMSPSAAFVVAGPPGSARAATTVQVWRAGPFPQSPLRLGGEASEAAAANALGAAKVARAAAAVAATAAATLAVGRHRRGGLRSRRVARRSAASDAPRFGGSSSRQSTRDGAAATGRQSGAPSFVALEAPAVDFDFEAENKNEETQTDAKPSFKQFEWYKCWYPVHVVDICDPCRPHKMQLLGMNIVIWNDGPTVNGVKQLGNWRVFEDACPHRQAPLSEGRIEDDGNLLCSYHAWRFNGKGDCAALPYSPEHLQAKHMCNCRAKCKTFPTRVEDGLLFVWPQSGPEAEIEASKKDPPLIEELHDPELSKKWIKFPVNLRDLELGWDVFFENAMDPAHFLVAHHNVTGNRYTDPKWFDMQTWRNIDTDTGCAARGIPGCFDFRPPCLVKNQQDGGVIFAIYNTPTSPGKCRHIGFLVLDVDSIAGESGVVDKDAVKLFTGPVPIWLQHVLTSFFLHQDAVLLHHQEQNFRDKGFVASGESDAKFREVTYTPNEVDKGSIMFRRWLRTRAGGGVPWACDPTLPPRLGTNEKIFDVYNSHTKHCTHCLAAYRNINLAKTAAFGSAFAIALAAPNGPERVAGGAAAVALGVALQKLSELFEVYEFNHQDNK